MRIRLTKKYAEIIDGVDLSNRHVGDILDLPHRDASLLIAEGWASAVGETHHGGLEQRLMTPAVQRPASRMAEMILIVDPDAACRRMMVELLEAAHYQTVAVEDFAPAAQLLESAQQDLLVTAVRLGAFNGLHLVIRGHARDPRMAALVVDDVRDPVLERESRRLGVTAYLFRPVDADELLSRVAEAAAARERRHWSRTTVTVEMLVRIAGQSARLLDASYGGCRLESESGLPAVFQLQVPASGLSVNAERVWSRRAGAAEMWACGATLAPSDSANEQRWCQLVDTLRKQTASPV